MIFLRQFLLILLLLPLLGQSCFADTLYDRSLSLFKAKAQRAKRNDYSFVVLGDSRDGEAIFKKALKTARTFDPLFVLHGGDYSDKGGAVETAKFLSLAKESAPDLPLFVVYGNHENREVFAREIGPFDFTLESKRLDFELIALDNADYVLRPREQAYLRSRLGSDVATRFVAMHIPPKTWRWRWHTFTDGADQLSEIIARSNVAGLFFSHIHFFDRSKFAGVPAFVTGGAGAPLVLFGLHGDSIYHILLVHVKDGKATFTKVPID